MDFSERLRTIRQEKKLNQTAVGKEIRISLKQIQRYEAGDSEPTLSVLLALADFFDVSLDFLTGRNDNPNSHKL